MHGSPQKQKIIPAGVDTDTLGRKVSQLLSEDRIVAKTVKTDLKFGMSKESPFLHDSNGKKLVHPSTKIIFGVPDKRPRPYTSKANSMIRKSLIYHHKTSNYANKEDSFNTNAFTEFAKSSLPPEKQKLIAFYSSANTLKGLRKKIENGKLKFVLIYKLFWY